MKNIITRTITGLIYIMIIVGGLCFHPYLFMPIFSILTALVLWEFYGLADKQTGKRIVATTGGVYLFCASFLYASGYEDARLFLPYILFIMYIFISELYNKKASNHIHNLSYLIMGQVYCAAPFALLSFIVYPNSHNYTPYIALFLFIFVWINDTGAFLTGSAFGKHRLFERVSPKKSWEGFVGGLVLTMASSLLAAKFIPDLSLYTWLGLSVVVVIFATWGDLVESLLKRTIGVKDTGKLLPGHGGILDRFDSILMAIPALYIYLKLFIQN